MNFPYFLLLTLFLTTVSADDCSPIDKPKHVKCLKLFNDIRETSVEASAKMKDSIVYKGCLEYPKCVSVLTCKADKDVISAVDKMSAFCQVTIFRESPEFADCDAKLDPNKSICVKEWKPFPEPVEDPVKMAEIQKEACKNNFGKDNCMEKVIRDNCGAEMWKKFKEYLLTSNKLDGACDFD